MYRRFTDSVSALSPWVVLALFVCVNIVDCPQAKEDIPGRPMLDFCIPLGDLRAVLDPGRVVQSISCVKVATARAFSYQSSMGLSIFFSRWWKMLPVFQLTLTSSRLELRV